jgi:hypothetical protein
MAGIATELEGIADNIEYAKYTPFEKKPFWNDFKVLFGMALKAKTQLDLVRLAVMTWIMVADQWNSDSKNLRPKR